MLRELDAEKRQLGTESYGLAVTTLEEVFLNVARGVAGPGENCYVSIAYVSSLVAAGQLARIMICLYEINHSSQITACTHRHDDMRLTPTFPAHYALCLSKITIDSQ